MLLKPHNFKGQTIIELAYFVGFFAGFMVLLYYTFSMFNISQKQQMLLRNQAFMELGNYSDYGQGKHGEDKVKDEKSRVTFKLGQRSQVTRVGVDKLEPFVKATQGELKIDVTNSINDDYFWETYQLPKAKVDLVWLVNRNAKGLIELDLEQTLAIAHNRSIDLKKGVGVNVTKTGLFSGSIQMATYAKVMQIASKISQQEGLIDDIEIIRRASRELVKNDSSLSDQAAKLEKSLNAIDGLTGGAQAALISAAIQVVMVKGLESLKSAFPAAQGAANGASSGGSAAGSAGSSTTNNVLNTLAGGAAKAPEQAASSFLGGDLLSAPFKAAISPVTSAYSGFAGALKGTAGLATGSGAVWGNMTTAMSGLSQVGSSASFGMRMAGTSLNELNIATAALAAPGAVTTGVESLTSSLNNTNTSGVGDWVGATRAVTQIITPITSLVGLMASDLAVPLSYVNTGLGVAGTLANGYELAKGLGNKDVTLPKTLKDVGAFTTSVGALYSGIAGITGNDPTIGAYISLGGSAMMGLGAAAELAQDMKLKGLKIQNPIDVVKHSAEKNVSGLKETFQGFGKEIKEANSTIKTSMAQIFNDSPKIKDPTAKEFMMGVAKADRNTSSAIDRFTDGVRKGSLSEGNLIQADKNIKEMQESVILNMKYHGASDQEIAQMKAKFEDVHKTIDHLKDFKDEKVKEVDSQLLANGKKSVDELNQMLGAYFANGKESDGPNPYAQQQIKAIRGDTSQKELELAAVKNGQTFEDQRELERVLLNQGGLKEGWFTVKGLTGGNRTLNAYDDQQRRALELSTLATAERSLADKKERIKEAVTITQLSEGVSLYGPIVSNNPKLTQERAETLATKLRMAMNTEQFSDQLRGRMEAQTRKLDLIAAGRAEIISEREWFDYAQKDIDRSAAELQQRQQRLQDYVSSADCGDAGC